MGASLMTEIHTCALCLLIAIDRIVAVIHGMKIMQTNRNSIQRSLLNKQLVVRIHSKKKKAYFEYFQYIV